MSEPLILKLKNKSKIVATSNVRQPISATTQVKVTFSDFDFSGEIKNLTFSNNEIIVGKGIKKIAVRGKVYASLLKPGAYIEIRIYKNDDSYSIANAIEYGSEGNEIATIRVEAEMVDVQEGDRISLTAYNSNMSASIALETFIKRSLVVEVLD